MANIKDLKKRIKSTKSTYKITSAMKLVSAAKLSKAQAKITNLKPYTEELSQTVRTVSAVATDYTHPYLEEQRDNQRAVLLVISSDKGLCGSYNTNVVKRVRKFLSERKDLTFQVQFVGKKAKEVISKEVNLGKTFHFKKADPTADELRQVANELAESFLNKEIGYVYVVYNSFVSAMSFNTIVHQVLPFSNSAEEKESIKANLGTDFKYEPSPKAILDSMIPEVFTNYLYTAVLDAIASEHGSRMVAMESASKNCKEMIKKLTLKMNKLRQAAITTELIEVVSGAESLKG